MSDTHESVRNLTDMLARLAEENQRSGQQSMENQFRNKQLAQQAQEMEENRKARADYMNEMVNARRQQAFLPFQERLLTEEQKLHPKWSLQEQVQDALHQMKPEYRSMSAFGYDPKFNASQLDATGNPVSASGNGPNGQGINIMRAFGLDNPDDRSLEDPGEMSLVSPKNVLDMSLTPYAVQRAKAFQMKLKDISGGGEYVPQAEYAPGSGSNLGF